MTAAASPVSSEILNRLDERVRRVDEDRWLSSRYATPEDRARLIALYAFNYELARVRLIASEPTLGAIRFQWWRDTLDEIEGGKPVRKHDTAEALAALVEKGPLTAADLHRLVDGHEDAFEAGDRALEPEPVLLQLAIRSLNPDAEAPPALLARAIETAALRRGDKPVATTAAPKLAASIRPASAHLRLGRLYARAKAPGPIARRFCIMRAVSSGRV